MLGLGGLMFNNVYKGRKVLITGNTGFKGSWLSLWLLELGADVYGYSLLPPTTPSLFEILELRKRINYIEGDIRDFKKLEKSIREIKPEIIFHLAAQPLVRDSYRHPRYTYEVNIMGTVNLFETIRQCDSVKVVINVTSDKCYQNNEWVYGYRENDPLGGDDPYSSSKGCSEIITNAYIKSFFNPERYKKEHNVILASVRAGNVIGGGDWAKDRLIPDSIRYISQNKEIIIRNPDSIRPWQYVLEPISGYLWLASLIYKKGKKYSGAWNFGPLDDKSLTVEEVVKMIIKLWRGRYIIKKEDKLYESKQLRLDISKALYYLQWRPVYKVEKALSETINWYKNYYENNKNMYKFTLKTLSAYINEALQKDIKWSH